jgi:hypothetical protein
VVDLAMLESEIFQGKSILFLSPSFFGYEVAIKDKLMELGAKVFYVDDRPSNSSIATGLIRINKNLAKDIINKYYDDVLSRSEKENFDVIFLLNPEALPLSFLEVCKLRWPKAYYVMYMWDSVKNRKHTLDFLPYCDRVFTFDRSDAEAYGFKFKPLFYLDAYRGVRDNPGADEYDLCFMGTAHSDRYGIAREVRDWCEERGLRCFFYFYIQGLGLYWFNKLKSKGVMPSLAEVSFEKMSFADIVRVVGASRVVLDIQHPRQTGLTMRTLETLGAGRRLVTTNSQVKEYDFYDARQVQIVDRIKPSKNLDLEFFTNEQYHTLQESIKDHSIGNWLIAVLQL